MSGKNFELARGDGGGPETFTKLAAVRSKGLRFTGETIDITTSDSNNIRELAAGGGIKSVSGSFGGVVKAGNAQLKLAQGDYKTGAIVNYQVTVPDLSTYVIPMQVTDFEASAEHNGEISFSLTLESAGDWTTVDF